MLLKFKGNYFFLLQLSRKGKNFNPTMIAANQLDVLVLIKADMQTLHPQTLHPRTLHPQTLHPQT